MRLAPVRVAVLAATLALAFVGCGDGDDNEFRDDYDAVSRDVNDVGEDVAEVLQAVEGKSGAQLAGQFRRHANELADLNATLSKLEPPSDLEEDVEDLEAAIDDVGKSLLDIAEGVERSDSRATRAATLDLIQRGERLDKVEQRVRGEASE